MPIQNTPTSYGGIAKTFHWLTALLILTAIPLGLYANGLPYDTGEALAWKAQIFSLHKTVGIAAFAVALLRILWALTQPKPAPLHPDRRAETWLAETAHWTLYISLVVVPLSGWIHHAATTGFAPILWPLGQSLPLVPKSEAIADLFAATHFVFTKILAVAVLLHIAGAMKHLLVDKDQTLQRMLPFTRGDTANPTPTQSHRTALFTAAGLYAIGLGAAIALSGAHSAPVTAAPTTTTAETGSWTVNEGSLEITVRQLGSDVTGSFTDWSATINFDETATDGRQGDVTVQIAITSLTLGSVTAQALGPDFFAAETHPTATFTAEILAADDGYTADGTLTLKGVEVPVALPFTLTLDGDTAQMTGATTLDRRNFAIGETYPDESSVGFTVGVDVSLIATRAR